MRVPITYIASSGHKYNLITNGILHKKANYHAWAYRVQGTKLQYGSRVADFAKDSAVYETELILTGGERQRQALVNSLHDDFEADIRNKKMGRIIWGDYYIDCYINESTTEPATNLTQTSNKISIYAPYPFWVQEYKISLYPSQESQSGFLDFPFDFPFDFTAPVIGETTVKSDFPFDSEFEMVIFGPAVNPRVTINGYGYVLYTTIPSGAYVVIDSRKHTVMQFNTNGTQTNMFNFRNKTDSIFQKIPGGNLNISWDASFGVNITIYHERSEPRVEVRG
jgi:hypothetical protein